MYQNKTVEGKRKWIPLAWTCIECGHTYKVASDTLMYKIGHELYDDSFNQKCPKCSLGLVRVYRHKNPKYGKQEWISKGWYCTRCKQVWMDKKIKNNVHMDEVVA